MVDEIVKSQAFKLKGRLYTFTVIHLLSSDKELFHTQVLRAVKSAPRLFNKTPVIIDSTTIADENIDFAWVIKCLQDNGMRPIAMQGILPEHIIAAEKEGLPLLNSSANQDKVLGLEEKEQKELFISNFQNVLITNPVRSGQQVSSPKGDLIITSTVSHGAELLASGNIHIYGALRGRALAGINGDVDARIFCQALDAELIAIAGIYCVSEAMQVVDKPCQIYLKDKRIKIEPL